MNIDKLKPAWRQYKLQHAQDELDSQTILSLIEGSEAVRPFFSKIALLNGALLCFMMVCCQGG